MGTDDVRSWLVMQVGVSLLVHLSMWLLKSIVV